MTSYEWDDAFAPLDQTSRGWAHHGLGMTSAGELVAFHPEGGRLLFVDPAGACREVECGVTEAHDLLVVTEPDGTEAIWVADCGFTMCPDASGEYVLDVPAGRAPRVVKLALDGTVTGTLPRPDVAVYESSFYVPTAVAVAPTGDVWVADGYGAGLVHRFDGEGSLLASIDGSEGAGRFDCPHGLRVWTAPGHEPELYVADRERGRIQVFDLDGGFRRVLGGGVLGRPCAVAFAGETLVVADLAASVSVFDLDGNLVETLYADPDAVGRPGWPNSIAGGVAQIRPEVAPRRFNSPHGVAVGPDGAIHVCEWLIGGRLVRLLPAGGVPTS